MLTVENLSVKYGVIQALHDVSLRVNNGEIVTLIGSNGAGKTTTLGALSGLLPASSGKVTFRDRDLFSIAPHERVPFGLVQVPEGRRIFGTMTVAENLDLGAYARKDRNTLPQELDEIYQLFPRLAERRKTSGGHDVGRRTANARRRSRLDEPPAIVVAR